MFGLLSLLLIWMSPSHAGFNSPQSHLIFNDQTLTYHQVGNQSDDLVILLGGGPGFSSWNLEPIQTNIAEFGYRVVLMDMAGIGENRHINSQNVIQTWVNQIQAVRQALDNDKPVTLIGHSWGGLMAMLYLRAFPENIAKVVLLNPVDPQKKSMENLAVEIDARNRNESNLEWDSEAAWTQNTAVAEDDVERITLRQIQQVLPTYFFDYEQGQAYAAKFTTDDFDIEINIQAWKEYDADPVTYSQLSSLNTPFYFLECEHDYLMPYNLMAIEKGMELEATSIMKQCGHFPWVEQEARFFETLKTFLDK